MVVLVDVEEALRIVARRTRNSEVLDSIRSAAGKLDPDELYDYIIGICWSHNVPLTPKDVSDLKRALGLS
jgi:hypothetical protein